MGRRLPGWGAQGAARRGRAERNSAQQHGRAARKSLEDCGSQHSSNRSRPSGGSGSRERAGEMRREGHDRATRGRRPGVLR